jgi:hypothetical protein
VSVNVCPPAAKVPVRGALSGFVAAATATTPVPDPDAPETIVIQVTLVSAVQAQQLGPEMLKVAGPPSARRLAPTGVRVNEQVRLDCASGRRSRP